MGAAASTGSKASKEADRIFSKADNDKNGKLSVEELSDAAQKYGVKIEKAWHGKTLKSQARPGLARLGQAWPSLARPWAPRARPQFPGPMPKARGRGPQAPGQALGAVAQARDPCLQIIHCFRWQFGLPAIRLLGSI